MSNRIFKQLAGIPSDIEIAQSAKLNPVVDLASELGIKETEYEPYGHFKGKVDLSIMQRLQTEPDAKLMIPMPFSKNRSSPTQVKYSEKFSEYVRIAVISTRNPLNGS